MSLRSDVEDRYPSLVPLLKIPAIASLLTKAVAGNWSPTKFQSNFIASAWFRSQSEAQRRWFILGATDPGEAKDQTRLMNESIIAQMRRLGVVGTSAEIANIRNYALSRGLKADDFSVQNAIVRLAEKGGRATVGAWTTTAEAVRQMAFDEFQWPVPAHVQKKWTQWIVTGQRTMEDYQAQLSREAQKRLPHMAERLQRGETVGDIIGPYRQLIAEELELGGPGEVKMSNPKYRSLMGIRDPKTKQMRMMTESEVLKLARDTPEWWKTSKGRQADASMVTKIREMFGTRKM